MESDNLLSPRTPPELAPPQGGTAFGSASAFALWDPRQAAGPPGRGVAGNPIFGAGHPSSECALRFQQLLPGGSHFSNRVLTVVPGGHAPLFGPNTCN